MLDIPSKSNLPYKEVQLRMETATNLYKSGKQEMAKKYLEQNITVGCTDSMVFLGVILADGDEKDRARSIQLFRQASELGNSSGTRNLAYCYAIGFNVDKDKVLAAKLYTKAADMGNARAACNIGVMYDFGNGVEKDPAQAFHWYTISAEGGCTRGMTNLGEMYLYGRGTEKDVNSAIKWLGRSGSPRALYHLSEIYLDEPGCTNPAKGVNYLRESADAGYSKAMAKYGIMLSKFDFEKSLEYINAAAIKGNGDAIQYLTEHRIPVHAVKTRMKKKTN